MSSTEDNYSFIFDGDYEENTYPEYLDDNFRRDFLGQDDSSKIEKNPIEENSTPNYLDEIEEPQKPNTEAHKTSKLRKKRGRKPKIDDENSKKHSNDYRDNIVYKIKSHFHSFIIKYLNLILSIAGVEGEFSNFYGKFQKDITRKTNSKLLDLPISDFKKYTKH